MLETLDKRAVRDAVVAQLTADVEGGTARARAIAASATHEEARPENDKDTRATEESYLARGQAARVAELQVDLASLKHLRLLEFDDDTPIALSALVALEDPDGAERVVWIVPRGGGRKVVVSGTEVQLTTPASPLGRALVGSEVDAEIQLVHKRGPRTWTVVEVT